MKNVRKILSVMLVLCICISVAVPYTACAADTVIINTARELYNASAAPDKNYVLNADIVFAPADFAPGGAFYLKGNGLPPIGTQSAPFSGTFDGNGHTIKGIKISYPSEQHVGLFGYVTGTVKNVGLVDADITGGYYTGGIAGYEATGATVTQCYMSGGKVASKYNGANVRLGGLVGCIASGSTLSNSYNTANVSLETGRSGNAAGIAGEIKGQANCCYNAAVFDENTRYGIMALGSLSRVTNTSSINASEFGISGDTMYAPARYLMTDSELRTQSSMKGFDFTGVWKYDTASGYPYPTLRAVPHKMTAKNNASFASGTGTAFSPYVIKTAAQFALIEKEPATCYKLDGNITLPVSYKPAAKFRGILYGNGKTVSASSPLFIENKGRIENITVNSSVNESANTGAVAVKNSNSIGDSKVSGTVSGTNAGGFCHENAGRIMGCTAQAKVTASSGSAGGFAVGNTGLIGYACINEGIVTGKTAAGGIAASSSGDGVIRNASNYGSVSGTTTVGGIAGELSSDVYAAANYGSVTAKSSNSAAGGIAGKNTYKGKCSNSQNTGRIIASGTNSIAGGIMGDNRGIIDNLLNSGTVSGDGYAGGIAGSNNVEPNGSYGEINYTVSFGKAFSNGGTAAVIVGINNSNAKIHSAKYLPTTQKGYTGTSTNVHLVASLTREDFANPDGKMEGFDFGTTWNSVASLPTLKVFPYKAVTSVTLDKTSVSTLVGKTVSISASVLPKDATLPNVEWSSSNSAVASVSEFGVVTAKAAGTAVITATADGKSAKANFGTVKIERLSGKDRLLTAVAISDRGWQNAKTVVLANSMNYADALAGVPYAASLDAPILLTGGKVLEDNVKAQIKKLGAVNVVILGGPGVISSDIEAQLKKTMNVERVRGKDRYATSLAIAQKLGSTKNVIIATGMNYADALSISPYASLKKYPILYCDPKSGLSAEISQVVKNAAGVTVVGGAKTILDSYIPNKFTRVSGPDRFLTSYAIAEKYAAEFGNDITIATGMNFPDALAGGVLCAKLKTPLLLSNGGNMIDEMKSFIRSRNPSTIYVLGGQGAVPDSIFNSMF